MEGSPDSVLPTPCSLVEASARNRGKSSALVASRALYRHGFEPCTCKTGTSSICQACIGPYDRLLAGKPSLAPGFADVWFACREYGVRSTDYLDNQYCTDLFYVLACSKCPQIIKRLLPSLFNLARSLRRRFTWPSLSVGDLRFLQSRTVARLVLISEDQ